ncbi:hypothetical protein MSAN_02202200 [Mycena sanguinolenta]|uniref:RING-type domain-containing protein n=1 Tax=Mycena sanguinolenta TaxID=230812 RepID=A0A8H6XDZ3_9AGAR|nr:hypothetical protein MSAN_02202200 [Mycena sanguinolenta]
MPATCSICFEAFTFPVSLPCGHIFCRQCIRRAVNSIQSYTIQYSCPTCRAPYSVLTVDPAVVPPHLRPHILPAIRPVFFDNSPVPSGSASTSTSAPVAPITPPDDRRAATEAGLNALRMECAMWRRRAETHAAANTNLLGFVRAAKDCALRLRAERDAERSRYVLLKRKFSELMPELDESPFATKRKRAEDEDLEGKAAAVVVPARGLPIFVMQCKAQAQHGQIPPHADADKAQEQSLLGPPIKRRRSNPVDLPITPPCVPRRVDLVRDTTALPSLEAGHPPVVVGSSSCKLSSLGAQ